MQDTRKSNSIKNANVAWIAQVFHVIAQFVARTAIIKVLSVEYIGLNGLFSNILTILSLAELGIGDAIVFSLYKPIAENNVAVIQSIMQFYKKVYLGIGIFMLAAGGVLSNFLVFFVKDIPDIPHIELIFILFVCNTAVSYFFSYKASFLTANQKNYFVQINTMICEILMVTAQCIALFVSKNFVLYLVIGVGFVLLQNFCIAWIADRKYEILKSGQPGKMPDEIKKEIMKNTSAMILHKMGSAVVFATDNIIISKFIGLVEAGLYSNYCLVTNAVINLIQKVFSSITASVGNMVVETKKEHQKEIFYYIYFMNYGIYFVVTCCFFVLLNPFIKLWIGEEYILGMGVVFTIVIKLYLTGMRLTCSVYKSAMGLFWYNRFMPLAESFINLAASVWLVRAYGIIGVLLGTIISTCATCLWIEPWVVFHYGFHESPKKYFIKYGQYFGLMLGMLAVLYTLSLFELSNAYADFVCKGCLSVLLPLLVIILVFRRTAEYQYSKNILIGMIRRKARIQ